MLFARSLLLAAPTRIAQSTFAKPVLVSSTSQWLRYKSDRPPFQSRPPPSNPDSRFKSSQDLQYDPTRRLQRQQAKQDAATKESVELDEGATPSRNTVSEGQPGPARAEHVSGSTKSGKEYSKLQDGFDSSQSPRANTTSSSQPFESSTGEAGPSETVPRRPTRPLPDLRQGIPSTFAEEFLNKKATKTSDEADTADGQHINFTDDPRQEQTEGSSDGAGRDQGELPKSAYQTSIDKRRDAMAKWFYIAFGLLLSTGGVYLGRNWDTEAEERAHLDAPSGWSFPLFWERIKARVNGQRSYYTEPTFPKLLPDMDPAPPYTLVISLEDMLIHSEWSREHGWRTAKRPGADYFLGYMSQYYEIVLFTTMPMAYADQIIKKLDPYHFITWPVFREGTRYEDGQYIKVIHIIRASMAFTDIDF
jgi:import inner membrane translocase subunit TIM50